MVRSFHIRTKKIRENNKSYSISKISDKGVFYVPKNQVISIEDYTKSSPTNHKIQEKWSKITVTSWSWDKVNIPFHISGLQEMGEAFIEGETHFDVDWDYIIKKRRDHRRCFYCLRKFNFKDPELKKTRDHLIPKAILKAYGKPNGIPNNTVPCCSRCNNEKSNLHPSVYLIYISRKIHETGSEYYRTISGTLNQLIVKK